MAGQDPEVPDGYEPVAWFTFPSLFGTWKPSKVHLRVAGSALGVRCGARRPKYARWSHRPSEMREHMQDAGQCTRCLTSARAGA